MGNKIVEMFKKHKIDVVIISAILLVSVFVLLIINATRKSGAIAVVEIDGAVIGEYSLSENATYELNGGTNFLTIENGEAYMSFSSCPDHTCEKTGKIRYTGQTIICLPNKISITIKGETDDSVDLVS